MITVNNITAKSTVARLGKLRLSSAPAEPRLLSPWGSVMTLMEQAVQQVKRELTLSGRSDIDRPERKCIDGPAERMLVSYADRLYVLPFYCSTPTPKEIAKELSRIRPLDPRTPGTRRHCTKIPTFGLWYALHGKLKEKSPALDSQITLLAHLQEMICSRSLLSRTPASGLETAEAAANAVLKMIATMSAIGFASLETVERDATEAFLAYMTTHFSALQNACSRALDEQNPDSAFPVIRSKTWAKDLLNWETRAPRKEKIL